MNPIDPETPPLGAVIELMRPRERQPFARAIIGSANGPLLVLDGCRVPIQAENLTLRWWDENDAAWEVVASVERLDASTGQLTAKVVEPWRPAVLRRAARVPVDRAPVDLITHGGDGRVVRRTRVVCLDLSTSGCGVAGSGPPPSDGDVVRVSADTPTLAVCVDARIIHVATVAFGGWQAGLEFRPHTTDEVANLVAWRDLSTD
jgi:hypothetical protein